MPGEARVCVAVDVGLPLPARRVGVPRADVLGLEPLEFLLVTEFVGLFDILLVIEKRFGKSGNGPFCCCCLACLFGKDLGMESNSEARAALSVSLGAPRSANIKLLAAANKPH